MRSAQGIDAELGDCYRLAAQMVMHGLNLVLVHGTVRGQAGRIDHAWVEDGNTIIETTKGHARVADGNTIIETTSPGNTRFSKAEYRRLLQAQETARYPKEVVAINLLRSQHWGPWEPEEIADQRRR